MAEPDAITEPLEAMASRDPSDEPTQRERRRVRRGALLWLASSAIGGVILALPDSGPRLVSFSRAHGPSTQDVLGILLMVAGWAVFISALWPLRHRVLRHAAPRRPFSGGVFAAGVGVGLVVASVGSDYPHWWVIGAGLLVAAQALFAYAASR